MTDYQKRLVEQGEAWLNGNPRHNLIDDECCPDFSCCEPALFTQDRGERLAIVNEYKLRTGEPIRLDA